MSWLLSACIYGYLRFCYATSRVQWVGAEYLLRLVKMERPVIVAIWHGRLAYAPFFLRYAKRCSHKNIHCSGVISRHGDGRLIARVCRWLGMGVIDGSSNRPAGNGKGYKNRGGAVAAKAALAELKACNNIAITPDGPRGPREKMQKGVMLLAEKAQVPILPISMSVSPCRLVQSWDRFMLPLPFARVVMMVGEPLNPLDVARLESRLSHLQQCADAALHESK